MLLSTSTCLLGSKPETLAWPNEQHSDSSSVSWTAAVEQAPASRGTPTGAASASKSRSGTRLGADLGSPSERGRQSLRGRLGLLVWRRVAEVFAHKAAAVAARSSLVMRAGAWGGYAVGWAPAAR